MLLVIMTRSLIRLDNTVRASLNNDYMTNSMTIDVVELELKLIEIVMTNMTETDSDITRDDRDEIVTTKGYKSITRSYRREREGVGTNTNNDDITRGYN